MAVQPSYCALQVRRFDRDRYLTALFAPEGAREALFALYAFNLEVARVSEATRTPETGLIRLQWWREAIEELYEGRSRRHPVVEALAPQVARLDRARLNAVIDARERDFEPAPFATLAELESYAEATAGALAVLALELLGAAGAREQETARSLGTAWALVGLARATPHLARAGRTILPTDLLRVRGVDPLALEAGNPALAEVVSILTGRARELLRAARAARPFLDPAARPALLLGVLADAVLAALVRRGHDPWRLPAGVAFAPIRLALANRRGRF